MLEKYLHNLKVEKKLKYSLNSLMISFVAAILVSLIAIVVMRHDMTNFYQKAYHNSSLQYEVRKDLQLVGRTLLTALVSDDDAVIKSNLELVNQYESTMNENVALLSESYDDKAVIDTLNTQLDKLSQERELIEQLISEKKDDEAEKLIDGDYADYIEEVQQTLIVIGEKSNDIAKNMYDESFLFAIIAFVAMLLIGFLYIFYSGRVTKTITAIITKPILEIEKATEKLKKGELDVDITYESEDELGTLAANFKEACDSLHEIVTDAGYLLGKMAEGNFDVNTSIEEKYQGEFATLILSMRQLDRQLDEALSNINDAADQVALGSTQLAESAQELAEGATEQAGAIEELTATAENVSNIADNNAKQAMAAYEMVISEQQKAKAGQDNLNELSSAMERISETSREIQDIIGAIEDIASQTNLLSLNASIEAARAGEAGRGFAVVADQIGKLAADSAQSAVNTRTLIEKSLVEIENGNQITVKTVEVINKVLEAMGSFAQAAKGASDSSNDQAELLKQIEQGIEQISGVVQSNSAAAQESSATSEELSAQSENLKNLTGRFTFRSK